MRRRPVPLALAAVLLPLVASAAGPAPFTGRYHVGPDPAPIRIVVFSDYECSSCERLEAEITDVLAHHPEVSLSIKQYPFSADCNAALKTSPHPNACWAARVAETAGMLRGNDGFWEMHHWLFGHQGTFTDANLAAWLPVLGYDVAQFRQVMQDDEVLRRIRADTAEGTALGIYTTPAIFLNGVELKNWSTAPQLSQAVDALAAKHPAAATAAADHPPLASEKYVADWRDQPVDSLPPAGHPSVLGGDGAAIQVVIFGDYQSPFTTQADAALRAALTGRTDASYMFRYYPFDQACNPGLPRTENPYGCRASRAAEAASRLGGAAAYRKMHAWLLEHQPGLDDAALRAAAPGLGLGADALLRTMDSPEVEAAVAEDVALGRRLVRRVPTIYVNGRQVPRWQREGDDVLARIVKAAAAK